MLPILTGALAMLARLRPELALIVVLAVAATVVLLPFWMRVIKKRART